MCLWFFKSGSSYYQKDNGVSTFKDKNLSQTSRTQLVLIHQNIWWENAETRYYYICGCEGCWKQFNKGWSILDHVRMHENIRSFKCEHWEGSFTQKWNLKKYNRRNFATKLRDRKRFKCLIWFEVIYEEIVPNQRDWQENRRWMLTKFNRKNRWSSQHF